MSFHRFAHIAVYLVAVPMGLTGGVSPRAATVAMPDVTDEWIWATHHVLLMKVVEVRHVSVLPRQGKDTMRHVTLTIVESLTPEAAPFIADPPGTRTFPESWFAFPDVDFGALPDVGPGDELLVIASRSRKCLLFCRHLLDEGIRAKLVNPLRSIAELRKSDKVRDLFVAASNVDATVAMYALNRLLTHDELDAAPEEVDRMRSLRNSTNSASVPLLASRLVSRLSGKPEMNSEEYAWLIERLSQFDEHDPYFVHRHLRRLIKYHDERVHTIDQLIGVIADRARPSSVRSACLWVLEDHDLFQFDIPDAHSEALVDTATAALDDDCWIVRCSAGKTLYGMARTAARSQAPEATRQRWIDHVKTALRNAHERETEQIVRWSIEASLRRLDNATGVPESKEPDK